VITHKGPVDLADLYRIDALKACRLALRRTRKIRDHEERMTRINTLLDCCGVEAVRGEWQNGFWGDVVGTYCNTGDSYALTVLCVRGDSSWQEPRFMVTSWGDWVERFGERYGVK